MTVPDLSVVVPVYNEEKVLKEFHARLEQVLVGMKITGEILYVNDGSKDASEKMLSELRRADPRVRVLSFTRNFGHQIAVKAGLDHAKGQATVIIDADLQDPPELIPELWARWKNGYDVVYAVRERRDGESFFKKFTAEAYYRLIDSIASVDIPRNTGDFRLLSRQAVDVLKAVKEKNPYLRGLVAWTGFKSIGVPMNRQPRFAGKTKYSLQKMLILAWNGITHFSFMPLQLATWAGAFFIFFSCSLFVLALLGAAHTGASDMRAVIACVLFVGGIQLLCMGILGAYLAQVYDQARPRPLYVLKKEEV